MLLNSLNIQTSWWIRIDQELESFESAKLEQFSNRELLLTDHTRRQIKFRSTEDALHYLHTQGYCTYEELMMTHDYLNILVHLNIPNGNNQKPKLLYPVN